MGKGNSPDRNREPARLAIGPRDDHRAFFREARALARGLTVRPADQPAPVFEGIQDEAAFAQAILTCFTESREGRVLLALEADAGRAQKRR